MFIAQDRLGFFNTRLEQRVNEKGLTVGQLAEKAGTSYEHSRKLIAGSCLPSDELLKRLCTVLELSLKEMAPRLRKDRMIFSFGDVAWEICGIDPRLAPFYILMPLLSKQEQEHFIFCMKAFVEAKSKQSGR